MALLAPAWLATVFAGTTWDGDGADNNWGTGDNWNPNGAPPVGQTVDLTFAGTTRLTSNNNYTPFDDFRSLTFGPTAGAFQVTGNAIDLFGKIENYSTATQTISLGSLAINAGQPGTGEFNPVNGDLVINSTDVFTNGNALRIFGLNNRTVTFGTGTTISQGGSFVLEQANTAVFQSAHTYTGDTIIKAGTLAFAAGGSANSSIIRLGDVAANSGTAAMSLTNATGGQTLTSNIVVRPSASGTQGVRSINSLNTSGTNTLSGSIFLDADATTSTSAGGTLALTGSVIDLKNQTLKFSGAGNTTVSSVLQNSTGSGKVIKTGTGSLTLSGSNTFSGNLTVEEGTLSVAQWNNNGTNGPLGNSSNPVTLGGASTQGTLRFTGGGSNNQAGIKGLTLAAGGGKVEMVYTTGNRGNNYVHIGGEKITGSGGLTVDTFAGGATSRFIVIGSAAYTGPTVVAAGSELQTNYTTTGVDGTPFGAGLNGLGSAVTVNAGGVLNFFSFSTDQTVAIGSLSGSGIVQGEGGGIHTYKIGGDGTSTTFSGVIQNNGGPVAITKVGAGTLTLTGANTHTGINNITAGTIATDQWNLSGTAGPWGAAVNNPGAPATTLIQMNGGRILYTGASADGALRGVNLVSGDSTIDIVGGSTLNFAGGSNTFQSSGGNLIKDGAGTLQIGTFGVANNAFTGKVTINAGTLDWFGAGSMPTPGAPVADFITINNGAKFQLSYPDAPTVVPANVGFKVNGNAGIATVGTHTISGVISDGVGPGGITKTGPGILGLTGPNTFTGVVNVVEGAINTDQWNQSGAAGPWGAAANNAGAPATTFIQMNGGRINYTGGSAGGALRGVNLASGNNTIDVINGSTLTFAGGFNTFQSNGGNLIKEGAGTLQIGSPGVANNIFTGKATINAGALEWFGAGSMPTPGAPVADFITINNGGRFQLSYADVPTVLSANIGFQVSGTAGILAQGTHTIPGTIADGGSSGGILKTGAGNLVLSGTNTFSGALQVESGTVSTSVWNNNSTAGPLGQSTNAVALGGASTMGTLLYNGGSFLPDSGKKGLLLNAGGGKVILDIGVNRNSYVHLDGSSISGPGGLTVQTGGSRFIILESASFTGPTVVTTGSELQTNYTGVGDGTPFGVGTNGLGSALTVEAGGVLTFYSHNAPSGPVAIGSLSGDGILRGEGAGTHVFKVGGAGTSTTFGGTIQDSFNSANSPSALTKVGAGNLTLTGMSTYTGATTVTAGTLLVSGGNIATSTVTVDGGTLGGTNGTVGPTIVNVGGTLAPGSSIGTLNFSSSLFLAGNSLFEIDRAGMVLTSDLANVAGALTLGGNLTVTATGDPLAEGDSFTLFVASSFSGNFANLSLPSLSSGYSWDTSALSTGGIITVVPEPSTLLTAMLGMGVFVFRRRR